MISLHQVSKTFVSSTNHFQAVNAVSLQVQEGEIHGIIGTSGAGKSTLLRLINLLEKPDSGSVIVGNQDLTQMSEKELREARRNIGMIFQGFNLVSNRTVSGNVSIPLELAGIPRRERVERVDEFLEFVGLEHKSKQYPSQLSGGEKQRVAIARALANRPKVLLCDEPTSSLDPNTTNGILGVLKRLNQNFGLTIVIVTHEMEVVRNMCHNVSVMELGSLVETSVVDQPHD
ncbi:D-methionine transport system ATP-binding protein [Paenibacillus sp. DS2015]|uniref:methionine ABC transporter ATP-binding protein n=1 Tax=Paenibacillus sp. DS2015 TaxID=3373917 RepID=UPI003D1F010E